MRRISNIASIEGRLLLQDIYYKFKFEQQRNFISILIILWRICTEETELRKYLSEDIVIVHKLGLFRGTLIWLEEVVNRYYFSVINSFVYFGAAVFLVLVGLNRFTDKVNNSNVIMGLAFEAIMLLLMFFIMLFTPNDEILESKKDNEEDLQQELLKEIGEISRDFAVTSTQLDKISDTLLSITEKQNKLFVVASEISKTNADAVKPNPKMLEVMNETNTALLDFKNTIVALNETTNKLRTSEMEILIRKEIERILKDSFKGI